MVFFKMLSVVLCLWGIVELLMGVAGLCTYEVGTTYSLYIGIVCLLSAAVIHIVCKIVKLVIRNKYID